MADEFKTVSQLVSQSEMDDDELRWNRVVQLFRPGIRSWIQVHRAKFPFRLDQELESFVDMVFADAKAQLLSQLDSSPEKFNSSLTQAVVDRLNRGNSLGDESTLGTKSFKFPSVETASFNPDGKTDSADRILDLLPRLSDPIRRVAAMRCIEGLKYRQIADRIGIEVDQVVSLDRQAQARLLSLLESDGRSSLASVDSDETLDAVRLPKNREHE
jgi:hypothetical protein